ncbi:accessory gene regulator ArgB-like protein [Listeria costaricensis]|uniref:accessory gene regulator ArgB-like protein n=1 Tax=Listeria costaricensis TaxID=2026604 RepID=UPI000C0765D9|nr:accessory gene regulator ArgB-like protein [Listeria costaricensis]
MNSASEKVAFSERLADRIISKERWIDDEEGYLKVKYGLEIMIINGSKLAIVYGASLLFGLFFQTLLTHVGYLVLRRYSFGLHAKSSVACTIVSLAMFVAGPLLFQHVPSNNLVVLIVFTIVLLCMIGYAPADTESLPLVGEQERKKLKRKAIISTVILMGVTVLIPVAEMKTLIMLGSVYQVLTIHPVTYKILKRRYRNYEIYE